MPIYEMNRSFRWLQGTQKSVKVNINRKRKCKCHLCKIKMKYKRWTKNTIITNKLRHLAVNVSMERINLNYMDQIKRKTQVSKKTDIPEMELLSFNFVCLLLPNPKQSVPLLWHLYVCHVSQTSEYVPCPFIEM